MDTAPRPPNRAQNVRTTFRSHRLATDQEQLRPEPPAKRSGGVRDQSQVSRRPVRDVDLVRIEEGQKRGTIEAGFVRNHMQAVSLQQRAEDLLDGGVEHEGRDKGHPERPGRLRIDLSRKGVHQVEQRDIGVDRALRLSR